MSDGSRLVRAMLPGNEPRTSVAIITAVFIPITAGASSILGLTAVLLMIKTFTVIRRRRGASGGRGSRSGSGSGGGLL